MKLANLAKPKPHAPREPLMTLAEFCKETGISIHRLRGLLKKPDSPKPRITRAVTGSFGGYHYYLPSEMRKWWRELQQQEAA